MSQSPQSRSQNKSGSSVTATIHVEDGSNAGPWLYTGDLRPGSRVVLTADSSVGSAVTVRFDDGKTPLRGCGSSFELGSGAPTEFIVADNADGTYGFQIEADGQKIGECRLIIASDGPLDKTGFVVRKTGATPKVILLCYQEAEIGSTVTLNVIDKTNSSPEIAVRETGGEPQLLKDLPDPSTQVTGFGTVASVDLLPAAGRNTRGDGQTGGTEIVDIVVEPV